MRDWRTEFTSYLNSGVHAAAEETQESELRAAAEACGLAYFRIDLCSVEDKAGFLAAIAGSLRFPPYFGMNWDALQDCLTDLSWLPAAGYVLCLTGFAAFSRTAPAEAEVATRILRAAADFWRENEVPFHAVLSDRDCQDSSVSPDVSGT